jgi:hypothetical protein
MLNAEALHLRPNFAWTKLASAMLNPLISQLLRCMWLLYEDTFYVAIIFGVLIWN